MHEVSVLHIILTSMHAHQAAGQQQCTSNNFPVSDKAGISDFFLSKLRRAQVIVPAFRFYCTGKITGWNACFNKGLTSRKHFVQFQVWRPTGATGCFQLVGANPQQLQDVHNHGVNFSQLLVLQDSCVKLEVEKRNRIEFQPGDVIGFYTATFLRHKISIIQMGIQVVRNQNVKIYFKRNTDIEELKPYYVISDLHQSLQSCGFSNWEDDSHQLTSWILGEPMINVTIGKICISMNVL